MMELAPPYRRGVLGEYTPNDKNKNGTTQKLSINNIAIALQVTLSVI